MDIPQAIKYRVVATGGECITRKDTTNDTGCQQVIHTKRHGRFTAYSVFCKSVTEQVKAGGNVQFRPYSENHGFAEFGDRWRKASPQIKQLCREEAKRLNANPTFLTLRTAVVSKMDKMVQQSDWRVAAIFVSPNGQVEVHGGSEDLAELICRSPLLLELEKRYAVPLPPPPKSVRQLVREKLNKIAARDLRRKTFPYAEIGKYNGQFRVHGVPSECAPLRSLVYYQEEKLNRLLQADIRLSRKDAMFLPPASSTLIHPSFSSLPSPQFSSVVSPFTPSTHPDPGVPTLPFLSVFSHSHSVQSSSSLPGLWPPCPPVSALPSTLPQSSASQEMIEVEVINPELCGLLSSMVEDGARDPIQDSAEDATTSDNNYETDPDNPLAANTMSGPIKNLCTCQQVKTEPTNDSLAANTMPGPIKNLCTCQQVKPETTVDPLIANTMSAPIKKLYTCRWIETEPVEENKISNVFHQFQSEPVDKSERKADMKRKSLTGVGLSCGQMNSGTTGSFEQLQLTSSTVNLASSTDFESNSLQTTASETVIVFCNKNTKLETDVKSNPEEAVTSSDVNMERPDIGSCDQTEAVTDTNVTVTGDAVRSESVSVSDQTEAVTDTNMTVTRDAVRSESVSVSDQTEAVTDNTTVTVTRDAVRSESISVSDQTEAVTDTNMTVTRDAVRSESVSVSDQTEAVTDNTNVTVTRDAVRSESISVSDQTEAVTDDDTSMTVTGDAVSSESVSVSDQTEAVTEDTNVTVTGDAVSSESDQTEAVTEDTNVTVTGDAVRFESTSVTSMDEDQDKSSGDAQGNNEPCPTVLQDPGSNKPSSSVTTTPRPFVCDVCDKRFSLKHNLKTHKMIHTGQKSFVCDVCDKRFTLKQNLKRHKFLVHNIKK